MQVARGRAASTGSSLKPGRKIIEPPTAARMLVATNRPWVWKIGRACRSTSSAVNRQTSTSVSAFDNRFSWLSIAPFERPVVPEV